VLESIALALQEGRDVHDALIECLHQVVGWRLQDATEEADDVQKVLAQQRTGLVALRGDHYEFIHPTFREYLTAAALVQACGSNLKKVWRRVVSRWREENWREVALFVLGILSDENIDVTPLLEQILREDDEGLFFAATALAEQVRVADDLASQIVNALLVKGRRMAESELFRHPNALEVLSRLDAYVLAAEGLLTLARDETVGDGVRLHAATAVGKLGRADDAYAILLTLACKEMVRAGVRCYAATALGEMGRPVEACQAWLAVARDGMTSAPVRLHAITALKELEQGDEAAPVLLTLARDRELDDWVRLHAAEMLMGLGRSVEARLAWLALARDKTMEPYVHLNAARALGELGLVEEAASVLVALARDGELDNELRLDAATTLGKLGRVEEAAPILLALARHRDEWVGERPVDVRRGAMTALGELGRVDDLLTLARDQTVEADVRLLAATVFWELGRSEEAAPALLALAYDESVSTWVRLHAATALRELGRVEEAAPILLALARDESLDIWLRCGAAVVGEYIDASISEIDELITELKRIAQLAAYEDVRRAAQGVADWIRRRMAGECE
jgi:tetratricopeptide (TPR) repeat protein